MDKRFYATYGNKLKKHREQLQKQALKLRLQQIGQDADRLNTTESVPLDADMHSQLINLSVTSPLHVFDTHEQHSPGAINLQGRALHR